MANNDEWVTTELLADVFRTPAWRELQDSDSDLCFVLNNRALKIESKRKRISNMFLKYFALMHCQDNNSKESREKAALLYDFVQLD